MSTRLGGNLPEMAATKEVELPRGVKSATGMLIDGIFASEAIDSSGEILEVAGADISDFEEGKGVLNYEHRGDDAPGASPNDVVGKIVYALKILKETDCKNERQRMYWRKIELPFIYGIVRLYDAAGHPGAVAAAAQIRDHVANGEPILARFSIEGSTLKRDGQRLVHTVARRVALTLKPCNRSCDSGLLADPQAPKGFELKEESADPLASLTEKFEHPGYTHLGDGPEFDAYQPLDPEDLDKAITAGGGDVAPGSLQGGAALQREDAGLRQKRLVDGAREAYKAWNKSEPFRPFLKFRLPEADPEFIERFADLVDDYQLKKKSDEGADAGPLTIRGKPVPSTPVVKKPVFDEGPGILRTPRGSFPMYIPGKDPDPKMRTAFHNAMSESKPTKVHAYALKNWKKAHKLLRAGKLPEAVLMHATLFSNLSPNTPVPNQELMYGHLVDTMRQTGIDARSPEFASIKDKWMARDNPDSYPKLSPSHWDRFDDQLRIQNDSKLTGRKAGDIGGFMLANDKFQNMSQYHKMHSHLKDLVSRHGVDAQSAVREMMDHKTQSKLWEARRARAKETGKPDPGEFQGMPIKGLAPKTARYMYGMLGGGNVTVPDTHFARYLFGLEKRRDTPSIEYIKNLLWNEGNADVLDGIDRHYVKHHDAVKHMAAHPDLKDDDISPEHLAFPAFWRNWMAIVPHEQARGMYTGGFNEHTDHRPFWEAIGEHLDSRKVKKAQQDDWAKAMETAKEHLHWVETLGEGPAMMIYFAHLLPQLMGEVPDAVTGFENAPQILGVGEDPNGDDMESKVRKFENLAVTLGVAIESLQKSRLEAAAKSAPGVVEYQGQKVKPGFLEMHSGKEHGFAILGSDDSHFHVVPAPKGLQGLKSWGADDVKRMPRLGQDSNYRIHRWPEVVDAGHSVDADQHGVAEFNTSAAQRRLVHGLDMGARPIQQKAALTGQNDGHWRKAPSGVVYVKGENGASNFPAPRREVAYHNVARDIFGLGDMLATTALVKHPRTGQELAVVEKLGGATHFGGENKHPDALSKLGDSGHLDKAATMDWILGNWDRHYGNWMMGPDKKGNHGLKLIDHGHTFTENPALSMDVPDYLVKYHQNRRQDHGKQLFDEPLHSGIAPWVNSINADKLWKSLAAMSVPEEHINAAVTRLKHLQAMPGGPKRLGDIFDGDLVYDDMGSLKREVA